MTFAITLIISGLFSFWFATAALMAIYIDDKRSYIMICSFLGTGLIAAGTALVVANLR